MRKRQRKKNDRKRRVHPFSWAAAGIELCNSMVKTWLNNPESRCYQHCVDNAVVVRRGTGNRIDVEMTVPVFVPDEVHDVPITMRFDNEKQQRGDAGEVMSEQ